MRPLRIRAAVVAAGLCLGLAGCGGDTTGVARGADRTVPALTVRDTQGALLARVPLTAGTFAVSYRNSLYGTLAEERYRVDADAGFTLIELAADQIAVLEEYYAVPGPVRPAAGGDRRRWVARPARTTTFTELRVAATRLGERTVHVPGHVPVPLASLVTDRPTVVLDVEEAR